MKAFFSASRRHNLFFSNRAKRFWLYSYAAIFFSPYRMRTLMAWTKSFPLFIPKGGIGLTDVDYPEQHDGNKSGVSDHRGQMRLLLAKPRESRRLPHKQTNDRTHEDSSSL
jgi:hypothetical protein